MRKKKIKEDVSSRNARSDVGFETENLGVRRKESEGPFFESSQEMTAVGTLCWDRRVWTLSSLFPFYLKSKQTKNLVPSCFFFSPVRVVFPTSISISDCLHGVFFFFFFGNSTQYLWLTSWIKRKKSCLFMFLLLFSAIISLPAHLNNFFLHWLCYLSLFHVLSSLVLL